MRSEAGRQDAHNDKPPFTTKISGTYFNLYLRTFGPWTFGLSKILIDL